MATASSTVSAQQGNFGASINIISGIQGVSPGGQASTNMPVNARIHRLTYQTRGIGYGLNGTPTAVPATADAGATFTLTVSRGIITAIAIVGTVSTKGNGVYPLTITDPAYLALNGVSQNVGKGATGTYTVASSVVTAAAITNGGIVADIPPELFFTSQKHLVNGVVMRDISAANTLKIARANGYNMANNEFPVFFTEPWRKIVDHDQATAWDLIGQSTYQILQGISPLITSPDLQGTYEFDYLRNARMVTGFKDPQLFLRPIKQHTFTYNVPAGLFNVTSLPVDFPIQRMWLDEGSKGSITHVELYQDGNKVLEGTFDQVDEMLAQYGFNPAVYDFNCVFDPDERLGKALKVNNLVFRVYSASPGPLNITMEIQGDNYN